MIYLDLIFNLTFLVALSIVSGFIDKCYPRQTRLGVLLQGAIFGGAAVIGMLRPLILGPGLIFDGRSVMVSLCALFFGPWAALVAGTMTIVYRIWLGGVGTITGVLIILSSVGIGLVAHFRLRTTAKPPSLAHLYLFGLAVHFAMLALMFTLPGSAGMSVVQRIGLPVMLLFPLATILVGKILADQVSAILHIDNLRKSEESLNNIVENIPIMIFMKDAANLRFVKINKAGEELLGYSREELLGKRDYDFFPPQQADFFTAKDREVLHGGKLVEMPEEIIQTRYLGERVIRTQKISIADQQGKPEYLLGISEDITERKRGEEELRESEKRIKTFLDSTADMAFLKDDSYHHIIVNRALCKFYGKTESEIIGKTDFDLMPEKAAADCRKTDEQALRSNDLQISEEVVGGRHYETMKFPVSIAGGKRGIGGYIRDITDKKQAQEDIRRANELLEQKVTEQTNELRNTQLALLNLVDDLNASTKDVGLSNQALTATNKELEAFSYSVSHDLRAPLRGMDGFSQALLEDYSDKLDATGKNYLERIRAGTQRMGLLIDDMLKLSRINRTEFKRESVDLSEMIKAILLEVRQNNRARDVQVSIQEAIIIEGDRHLLEIALMNLIENAWKFTSKTENARIEFGMKLMDGKSVMFIRDNGIGFDMAYVDKLFGAFQRLHTTAEFPGTGIGLATVQRVIHRHGGKIWAEGEIGKGAVFYFTLPE